MDLKNTLHRICAAKAIASVFGVLGGLGGIVHGVGEVLQGNIKPDGMLFSSWAQGPIALYLDGDPAFTIIPNFLITGILTLLISTLVVSWSCIFIEKKHGGFILILLSIAMLLVGGGIGPPTLALLAGISGLGINASYLWWRVHLNENIRLILAASWPWVFGVCVVNGVFLVIGHVIAVYFFAPVKAEIFQYSFFFAVLSLVISIVAGVGFDMSRREPKAEMSG
ncbi:MAG: hypothetical protein OEY06_01870 [Gammaproteobacteria bacterium]|nr:hypothetical protein [Gammaproteobacteria bacterium]